MEEAQAIESISGGTRVYFKKHLWLVAIIIFAGIVTLYLLFLVPGGFFVFPLFVILVIWGYVHNKIQHEFIRQFANAIGYSYAAEGSPTGLPGALFGLGHSPQMYDVLTGFFENHPIRLFTYNFSTGRGKDRKVFLYTVGEINFQSTLPGILLAPRQLFGRPNLARPAQKALNLEGNFRDHFTLWVPEDFEIEAFEIFTPDVMSELLVLAKDFEIEFTNRYVYIYENHVISTKQELISFYNLAKYLVTKLSPRLMRLGDDVEAMHEARKSS